MIMGRTMAVSMAAVMSVLVMACGSGYVVVDQGR